MKAYIEERKAWYSLHAHAPTFPGTFSHIILLLSRRLRIHGHGKVLRNKYTGKYSTFKLTIEQGSRPTGSPQPVRNIGNWTPWHAAPYRYHPWPLKLRGEVSLSLYSAWSKLEASKLPPRKLIIRIHAGIMSQHVFYGSTILKLVCALT